MAASSRKQITSLALTINASLAAVASHRANSGSLWRINARIALRSMAASKRKCVGVHGSAHIARIAAHHHLGASSL